MQVKPIKTRIFRENEDLVRFISEHVKKMNENSILVVTSKIVALAEGRTSVYKDKKQKDKIVKEESDFAIKTKLAWLTVKDGMILASSGVDESNADGKLILLPSDSFKAARDLRSKLKKKFKLKNLGVLITDSSLMPLRAGVLGIALGYAGFKGIRNYIGTRDIFGKVMEISKTDVADSLATAAVLCMGEGNERQPLLVITETPAVFTEKINKKELVMRPENDIYAPLFKGLKVVGYKRHGRKKQK